MGRMTRTISATAKTPTQTARTSSEKITPKLFASGFVFLFLRYNRRLYYVIFNGFYANEFDRAKTVCGHTPDAAELIRKLRAAGIKVVLASNPVFPETAQKKRMQWAGVDPDDFEYITTYENSHYCKPNTKYYAELLEKLGYKAEDCIMVGNDVNEDMCAAEIGIKTFLLTDCMINAEGKDISSYDRGGFPELEEYLMQHYDI